MSLSLTIRTPDLRTELTFNRRTGVLNKAKLDGVQYVNESQWEVVNEGIQSLQEAFEPDQDNPGSGSLRSSVAGVFSVTYEVNFMDDPQIIKVYAQTRRTEESSGVDPQLSNEEDAHRITGRHSTTVPHFARNPSRIKVPSSMRDQKYTLNIFDNETETTAGGNNTERKFSGGPVSMSADGLTGVGVYAFGYKVTPNRRRSRWSRSEELSPIDEWQNNHAAPKGIHHDTRYIVLGDAQEIFDKFTALHNHHMAEQIIRSKNATRLDAPVL